MMNNCEGGECNRVLGVLFFTCYAAMTVMLPLVMINLLIAMVNRRVGLRTRDQPICAGPRAQLV